MAFNPAGTRLAVTGTGRGEVFDLASGQSIQHYGLTSSASGDLGLAWLGDRYLVLQGHTIVDLETGQPIWNLPYSRQPLLQYDQQTIGELTTRAPLIQVYWVRLPPERIAATAHSDSSSGINIPRNAVATVDLSKLQHATAEVRTALESKLRYLGYQLGDNGTLRITISSTKGAPETIQLNDFFKIKQSSQATYTPSTVTTDVLLNGKSIGHSTRSYGMKHVKGAIRLRQNETPQQAVTRLTTPSASSITLLAIPRAGGTYDPAGGKLIGTGLLRELLPKLKR